MTLYLVRHGAAGTHDDGDPADERRPLDPTGHLQAEKLSGWLRHEPLERIVSSPYLRCVQTVGPLAKQLGLEIELDDRLSEGTPLARVWPLVEQVATSTTVLCSHGDVIPDLIRRAQLRGMHVPGRTGCAKGSAWILQHWDGERFATGVYTPIKI